MNLDLAVNKIHPVKKYLLYILPFAAIIFLAACNPEEQASIVNEEQDPIGGGEDTPGDIPIENPSEPNTEYTADIFFIDRNTLYGIRDRFFDTEQQGIGQISTPFLEIDLPSDDQVENQSTPLIYSANNEMVNSYDNLRLAVASNDGTLANYAAANSESDWSELWSISLPGGLFAAPAIAGNGPNRTLIAGDANGAVHGINANSGEVLWSWPNTTPIPSFLAPLEVIPASGTVIAASFGGWVFALDAQSGTKLWEFETNGLITAKPYYAEGPDDGIASILIATQEGVVFRLDAFNGNELWRTTLPPDRFSSTTTQFISSAPSSDGTDNSFFVASANSSFFNMNVTTGAIIWDSEDTRFDAFRSSIYSLDDTFSVGIGAFGSLYQFTRNGPTFSQVSWTELMLPNANEGGISGSPVMVTSGLTGYGKNRIYVKTAIGLYGIDQGETQIASQFEFGSGLGNSSSSPVVIGSTTFSGDVLLFHPPNIDNDN